MEFKNRTLGIIPNRKFIQPSSAISHRQIGFKTAQQIVFSCKGTLEIRILFLRTMTSLFFGHLISLGTRKPLAYLKKMSLRNSFLQLQQNCGQSFQNLLTFYINAICVPTLLFSFVRCFDCTFNCQLNQLLLKQFWLNQVPLNFSQLIHLLFYPKFWNLL